jgi:MerR family transcriptional regulator, copper efflux regulator
MDGLIISELARRSGVPTTTLRFYDQEGLLPARRSPAGYRLYDDSAVDRLAFITTAKSLGLQLPEIRQLLHTWQDGFCAQVQGELGPLLAQRIAQIHERIAELQAFAARLHQAQEQLSSIDRDGPCDPACTFLKATA